MAPQTQTRRIIIKVDAQGDKSLKDIKNQFKDLNKSVSDTDNILSKVSGTFNTLLGASVLGVGIGKLAEVSDGYQKLSDRIRVFEGSQEKANVVLNELAGVADRTRTSINGIATVYARLSPALSDAGISSEQLLVITEALQNTFRLSGATISEATAATIQLSQGLASGQLRGQELRSVLEQNVIFGEILAKTFKTKRGELLKLAEAGQITADKVLTGLANEIPGLEKDVKSLGVTFEEATTRGLNKFTIALGELNKTFNISGGFDKAITTVTENFKLFSSVLIGLAATAIPALIIKLKALEIASWAAFGPIGLLVGALIGFGFYIAQTLKSSDLDVFFLQIKNGFLGLAEAASEFARVAVKVFFKIFNTEGTQAEKTFEGLTEKIRKNILEVNSQISQVRSNTLKQGAFDRSSLVDAGLELDNYKNKVDLTFKKTGSGAKPISLKKQLEALNESFNTGGIGVLAYNEKLLNLTRLLTNKKGPTVQTAELSKVLRDNLNREFEYGIITIEKFNETLNSIKIDELNQKLYTGRITLAEYNKEILEVSKKFEPGAAIYTGINNYIESSGTLSQNIAKNITLVFNTLEDTLVEFVKTGTFEFKKFAQAVLDDLTRIIIRAAVIQPLAQGILGSFTGPNTGASGLGVNANGSSVTEGGFAKGGAFNQGVQFFADGGVVNRTTAFGYSGGLGVMGEAGPEAIIPLKRGSDGKLGVSSSGANVQVNIINQAGVEIEQTESTSPNGDRVVQVLIRNTVQELFASGGMDRTMKAQYGIARRGV